MSQFQFAKTYYSVVAANDNDALIPELWAQEALMQLEAQLLMANLVYRDYDSTIARFGDVVNTHKPQNFEINRAVDGDSVTIQDAQSTNVPVKLNQYVDVSFMIYDAEASKSFKELTTMYLERAMYTMARGIDRIIMGQMWQFMDSSVGQLGTDINKNTVIAVRTKMNDNLAPLDQRYLVVSPTGEGNLLSESDFVNANTVGDDGTALRRGHLGEKFGINIFMSQDAPSILADQDTFTAAVNNSGGYEAGTTSIAVDGLNQSYANQTGAWCTIAGDMTPQKIIGGSNDGGTGYVDSITISPGLKYDVADNASITIVKPMQINNASGYSAEYAKTITIDDGGLGQSVGPHNGQLISIGTSSSYKYTSIKGGSTLSLFLDRPLEADISDNGRVGLGPSGDFAFAFHPNAIALVNRPLALPQPGTGARSFVASYNGLSVRVTITYNGEKRGHLVVIDLLCGVKVLDTNLGVIVYG